MSDAWDYLQEQFDTPEQQKEADWLAMWGFLATEVLMFGSLFTGWAALRTRSEAAFSQATHHLDLGLGTVLTFVLLTSSLLMALAVHAAKTGKRKQLTGFLAGTAVLGAAFVGLEIYEYTQLAGRNLWPGGDFRFPGPLEAQAKLFFSLYFIMTGLHILHVTIGVCATSICAGLAYSGRFPPAHPVGVELVGLYWHFVDIVWVFLFPVFYLIGRTL